MTPDTLILFEILDFNHQALLYKDTDIYDKDNFFRVAWGIFILFILLNRILKTSWNWQKRLFW